MTTKKTDRPGPVFHPEEVSALSDLIDDLCAELAIAPEDAARKAVAARLIAIAAQGERRPGRLREALLGDEDTR
jgi:hypothetical protein